MGKEFNQVVRSSERDASERFDEEPRSVDDLRVGRGNGWHKRHSRLRNKTPMLLELAYRGARLGNEFRACLGRCLLVMRENGYTDIAGVGKELDTLDQKENALSSRHEGTWIVEILVGTTRQCLTDRLNWLNRY